MNTRPLVIDGFELNIDLDDQKMYIHGEVEYCSVETGKFYEAVEFGGDPDAVEYWRKKVLEKRMEYYNKYLEEKKQ